MSIREVITSFRAIEEVLKIPLHGTVIYRSKASPRIQKISELARCQGVAVYERSTAWIDHLINGRTHHGIVLLFAKGRQKKEVLFESFLTRLSQPDVLVILLNGIMDPQNYGAILRSADQFNVDLVVTPSRRSVSDTPAVFSASAGAAAWVPHAVVTNMSMALEKLKEKGFWIYGTSLEGNSLHQTKLTGRLAIVMGNEEKGLSHLVKQQCDHLVAIPTAGRLNSLNVSVAAGIVLYEVRRQQEIST